MQNIISEKLHIKTEQNDIGKRIDSWIAYEVDSLSRNAIQKLIENGNVLVNGNFIKSNYKLKRNDDITVILPPPVSVNIIPENIALDILYEDEGMIVVNKPKGMVVHPAVGHFSGTLVNALMYLLGDKLSSINGELRPGIVHRLDKDTSGVLAVAKNDYYHKSLSEQLQSREMSRIYKALVYGKIKEGGIIDTFIGRSSNDRKKMAVVQSERGRHAVTIFEPIEYITKNSAHFTLIKVKLKTGRTHQIRVHMAHIGHPIVGDLVYGRGKQPFQNCEGQVLHAEKIGFRNPKTDEYIEISAPLPDYFNDIIKQ